MKKLQTFLIIISALSVVGISLLIFILISIHNNRQAAAELAKKIEEQNLQTNQAENILSLLERTKESQAFLNSYFISDGDIVKAIETIENTGDKADFPVTISGLSADDSSNLPIGTINKVKARLDGKGSWKGALTFLSALEALPYKMSLSNISLKREGSGDKTSSPLWTVSLQIELLKIK